MGNGEEDIFLDRLDPKQGSFFVAGRAEEPCLARERDSHALSALGTFVAGDALAGITAGQKPFNGMGDDRAEEAIVLGIDAMIALLKVAEMTIDDLE
jgi:hypothetical protein